jgi:hypothetical protein
MRCRPLACFLWQSGRGEAQSHKITQSSNREGVRVLTPLMPGADQHERR